MTDAEFRELLLRIDSARNKQDRRAVTKLLRLAAAINEWDYPCVCRIECGYLVQDSNHVGDIQLLLSNSRGTWRVTVRPGQIASLVTIIDPDNAVDDKRENELCGIFQQFGYVYIPHRLLQERYPADERDTWFDRFFDYS